MKGKISVWKTFIKFFLEIFRISFTEIFLKSIKFLARKIFNQKEGFEKISTIQMYEWKFSNFFLLKFFHFFYFGWKIIIFTLFLKFFQTEIFPSTITCVGYAKHLIAKRGVGRNYFFLRFWLKIFQTGIFPDTLKWAYFEFWAPKPRIVLKVTPQNYTFQ